jgi:hypothetical protein
MSHVSKKGPVLLQQPVVPELPSWLLPGAQAAPSARQHSLLVALQVC